MGARCSVVDETLYHKPECPTNINEEFPRTESQIYLHYVY
jgi:hypothetical protein